MSTALHYHPWTDAEDAVIRECRMQGLKIADIAVRIGRTLHATEKRIGRLDLAAVTRVWSADEDTLLRELRPTTKIKDLAAKLGRSRHAVRHRLCQLNIRSKALYDRVPNHKAVIHWTPAEDEALRANYLTFDLGALSELLGRSVKGVQRRLRVLQLARKGAPRRKPVHRPIYFSTADRARGQRASQVVQAIRRLENRDATAREMVEAGLPADFPPDAVPIARALFQAVALTASQIITAIGGVPTHRSCKTLRDRLLVLRRLGFVARLSRTAFPKGHPSRDTLYLLSAGGRSVMEGIQHV